MLVFLTLILINAPTSVEAGVMGWALRRHSVRRGRGSFWLEWGVCAIGEGTLRVWHALVAAYGSCGRNAHGRGAGSGTESFGVWAQTMRPKGLHTGTPPDWPEPIRSHFGMVAFAYTNRFCRMLTNRFIILTATFAMRIDTITVENLLSFDKSTFNFKKYNVIVGPNDSGKTNLLRILGIAATQKSWPHSPVKNETKHTPWRRSQVALTVEATDTETRMILQMLLEMDITPEHAFKSWKNFTIVITWGEDHHSDAQIFIHFQNGTLVSLIGSQHYISHYEHGLGKLFEMGHHKVLTMMGEQPGISLDRKDVAEKLALVSDPANFFINRHVGACVRCGEIRLAEYVEHHSKLLDYIGNTDGVIPTRAQLEDLIYKIMQNNFVQIMEIHPQVNVVAKNLLDLKVQNETGYKSLQSRFEQIFPNTEIRVEKSHDAKEPTVWISENNKTFDLGDSASGYVEAVHILYSIANRADCIIFLDEPEIHFHPVRVRGIRQMLMQVAKDTGIQIIVITHSPEFLDKKLFIPNTENSLAVVTKDDGRSVVASPKDVGIRIKYHLIDPVMFFSNAVFLVEGPGDKAVIHAISDHFGGIFDKHGIAVVACGGYGGIKSIVKLPQTYSIKCYGLADKEYEEEDDIVKLEKNLEHELRKIMPQEPLLRKKLKPNVAYELLTNFLQVEPNVEKLQTTAIWSSVENVIKGQNIQIDNSNQDVAD